MIYDVRQTTSYTYGSKVTYARHLLRLMPVERPGQHVHAAALDIDPVPAKRHEGRDFFGNRMTAIEIDKPHETLTVRLAARLTSVEPVLFDPVLGEPETPAWERVRDEAFGCADVGARSPVHFLFPSRQVSLDPEIRDYARESFTPNRPLLAGAVDLMHRIRADFTYEIGATTVSTTPSMSFALRRGVCQDFAHIMISGLRGLGLPAAYVSGYLRTLQKGDAPRLEGADAMHAWVMVWGGGEAGWFGLDPTNGIFAGDDHIVLAIGRDYADVAPIDGVVFAFGGQKLDVAVTVIPVD
jgi:transglutaminase-like putative cysteine protease